MARVYIFHIPWRSLIAVIAGFVISVTYPKFLIHLLIMAVDFRLLSLLLLFLAASVNAAAPSVNCQARDTVPLVYVANHLPQSVGIKYCSSLLHKYSTATGMWLAVLPLRTLPPDYSAF